MATWPSYSDPSNQYVLPNSQYVRSYQVPDSSHLRLCASPHQFGPIEEQPILWDRLFTAAILDLQNFQECRLWLSFRLTAFLSQFSKQIRCSMVLADNVDGGDDLDLIFQQGMAINIYCFSTPASHHPLKTVEVAACPSNDGDVWCACHPSSSGSYALTIILTKH